MKKILLSIFITSGVFLILNSSQASYTTWIDNNFNDGTNTSNTCVKNITADSQSTSYNANNRGIVLAGTCASSFIPATSASNTEPFNGLPPLTSYKFKNISTTTTDGAVTNFLEGEIWDGSAQVIMFATYLKYVSGSWHLMLYHYTGADGSNTLISDDLVSNVSLNEWHDLMISYYVNSGDAFVKVFLDGTAVNDYTEVSCTHTLCTGDSMKVNRISFDNDTLFGTNGSSYVDDIVYSSFTDAGNVEIVEPGTTDPSIYVADEYWKYDRNIYCNYNATTTDCKINYSYPFDDVGKYAMLVLESDRLTEIDGQTITQNAIMKSSLIVPNPATTAVQNYCLQILNDVEIEKVYCGITVYWNGANVGDLWGIEPYDITTACEDVTPSDESLWDNFRYGMECGFNKSVYWLLHPQTDAVVDLIMAFDTLTNEFPINIYKSVYDELADTSTSTATFSIPLYVGVLGSASTSIPVFDGDSLSDTFGETWDNIYAFMEVIVYFLTFVYFLHWFVTKNNNSNE